jgi:hypothetical protein
MGMGENRRGNLEMRIPGLGRPNPFDSLMPAIRISNGPMGLKRIKVEVAALGLLSIVGEAARGQSKAGDVPMSELETKLNHILEEHQQESGLHMIGGRRRLIDRLVKFFEEDVKVQDKNAPAGSREN